MRFNINLVTKTYLNTELVNRWCGLIILLLVALLSLNVYRIASDFGELSRLRSENSVMEGQFARKSGDVSEKDFKQMTAKIGFYNDIIRKKSFSWSRLLEQLEGVTPEGIALSAVMPDQKERLLKIEGVAKNFKLVQSYLEKLEDSKQFTGVTLVSHSDINNGERSTGVHFSLSCKGELP